MLGKTKINSFMSQQEKTLYKIYNTIRDCNISLFLVSSDWIAHNAVAAVLFSRWEERIKALPLKTVFACPDTKVKH